MLRALINVTIVDGTGRPARPGAVLLDGNRVEAVLDPGELGADVESIDLGGRVVMPGLIDCHVHFALWTMELLDHPDEPISGLAERTRQALDDAVRAGCTAARDLGGLGTTYRDAIAAGMATGPRLEAAITILSPIDGLVGSTPDGLPAPVLPGMPSPICMGPVAARAKVRELVEAGADVIKVGATGGVSSPRRQPRQRLFSDQELTAIVEEAHAHGRPVACHALGGPGLLAAVRAGVDTIEHGVWLEEAAIAEMVARRTWYVPTLSAYELHARQGPPLKRDRAVAMLASHRDSVRRAREAGVRIASGSDGGVYGFDFVLELELLAAAGLTAAEAVAATTSGAAACLGWEDETGRVAAGLRADLLVLDADPTMEVAALRGTGLRVIQGGEPIGWSWPVSPSSPDRPA